MRRFEDSALKRLENQDPFIVSFVGGKGGVGTTTLCSEVAAFLSSKGIEVGVADLDLFGGDLNIKFDLALSGKTHTLSDLVPFAEELDSGVARNAFSETRVHVYVLPPLKNPRQVSSIYPSHLKKIIDAASQSFNILLVDCASGVNPLTLPVVSTSKLIILVTTPEIASISGAKRIIDALEEESCTSGWLLVVNRSIGARDSLALAEIEAFLGMRTSVIISEDTENARRLTDEGRFLFREKTHLARGILLLARNILSRAQRPSILLE